MNQRKRSGMTNGFEVIV